MGGSRSSTTALVKDHIGGIAPSPNELLPLGPPLDPSGGVGGFFFGGKASCFLLWFL